MVPESINEDAQPQDYPQHADPDAWVIRLPKPVRREASGQYLVYALVSFVISVSGTRLFLSLSSYVKLGSGEIHISHLLWGGLFLFIASLLLLLVSNRQMYKLAAIFSGIGIGLFIDEVGKFITLQNDYFYPLAAPIVYIFFMLFLILVLRLQRQTRPTPRSELHRALENLQDWVDKPLTDQNEKVLVERLQFIRANTPHGHVEDLAESILNVVEKDSRPASLEKPSLWKVITAKFDQRIKERGMRLLLVFAFLIMAFTAIKTSLGDLLNTRIPEFWGSSLFSSHSGRWYGVESAPGLYQARVSLEVALGILLFANGLLFGYAKTRIAVPLGFGLLIFYLTAIDPLLFYFEQFSTIIFVSFQYLLLAALIYYRSRFLPKIQQ